ncbi:MobA/MobL family protein, partial [Salmonella enterica subsp. enterica serovar Typhimurium]|nr:MobA/MobL family protein [Salmonella enterica subsp. enterica serovar Typhimurium]
PERREGRTYANFVCSAVGKPTRAKAKQQKRESRAVAIYSASVKTVSRGGGRSATAAAAYRNGEEITDERTGEVHDYRRRTGVEHVASFAPEGM